MNMKHFMIICIIAFAIVLSLTACMINTPPHPATTEQEETSSEKESVPGVVEIGVAYDSSEYLLKARD